MLSVIFLVCCGLFVLAYKVYGGWMERQMDVMDERRTPAHMLRDGVDYEPTPDSIVFGHHFSSIAGAGPIVGPIAAALAFGWGPVLVWIVLGSIFIGGVQDYVSMLASLRNRGCSLAQIGRRSMGALTYRIFLLFIFLVLLYVVIVFLDMAAATFAPATTGWGEEDAEMGRVGGVVATASVFYIALAVLFGRMLNRWRVSLRKATLIALPLVFAGLWLGNLLPMSPSVVPAFLGSDKYTWSLVLLAYSFAASVLPVNALLQPRDYLSSFLMYACLLGGAVGLLVGSTSGGAQVVWPMFLAWKTPTDGWLFPAVPIMVACGAVSGFHAVMASGTTSKQIDRESSAKRVALGAMLVEAALAVLALGTVMVLREVPHQAPTLVFAAGLERFFEPLGLGRGWVMSFAMLAISTFVLTTLDTCTRLGRLLLQEMTGLGGETAWRRMVGTLAVLALPAWVVFQEIPGAEGIRMPAWKAIWPSFGATNQLMGALALLMVYGWLRGQGRRARFVLVPMVFMFATTTWALLQIVWRNLAKGGSGLVGGLSLFLLVLALVVCVDMGARFLLARRRKPISAGR
jgi:carbon starvation protein